jgi:hypothetical protein
VSERPTIDEIAAAPGDGFTCVERLIQHGYVIVDAERLAWLERIEEAAEDMPIDLDDWLGDDD